jgi:hypothetical protein
MGGFFEQFILSQLKVINLLPQCTGPGDPGPMLNEEGRY